MPIKLGVLVSGRGTNLQSIIDKSASSLIAAEVAIVISDKPNAYALTRAREAGVPAMYIDPRIDKPILTGEAEDDYIRFLKDCHVNLVCLAGFMRILKGKFIREFKWKIMNIHPALLPSFRGLSAQKQALDRGVRLSGATVHFVTEDVDKGPIILQAVVPVYQDDTEESLSKRILLEEHRIYAEAIDLFAKGQLEVRDNRVIIGGDNG